MGEFTYRRLNTSDIWLAILIFELTIIVEIGTPVFVIFTFSVEFVINVENTDGLLIQTGRHSFIINVERTPELLIFTSIGFVTKVEIGFTTKVEIPGFIIRVENTDGLLIQTGTQLFVIKVDNTADELLIFILKPGFKT